MKLSTVFKKLGHYRVHQDGHGVYYFTSRAQDQRFLRVWDKGNGNCTAIPFVEMEGEEVVAFHAKTVKSLVEFMEGAK